MTGDGDERAGKDLRDIVEQARQIVGAINGLHSRYRTAMSSSRRAIGGVFDAAPHVGDRPTPPPTSIAERLDDIAEETEKGWQGRFGNDGFVLQARGARRDGGRTRSISRCSARSMRAA